MNINFEAKTFPEAYLQQCTSEILTALICYAGPFDDPRIGWVGRSPSTHNHFQCERCGAESLDSSQIQHKEGCSAATLLAVLEKVRKANA